MKIIAKRRHRRYHTKLLKYNHKRSIYPNSVLQYYKDLWEKTCYKLAKTIMKDFPKINFR